MAAGLDIGDGGETLLSSVFAFHSRNKTDGVNSEVKVRKGTSGFVWARKSSGNSCMARRGGGDADFEFRPAGREFLRRSRKRMRRRRKKIHNHHTPNKDLQGIGGGGGPSRGR